MQSAWRALLWKEWQEAKSRFWMISGVLIGFYLLLAVLGMRGYGTPELGVFTILIFPLVALFGGHQRMQNEWAGNHHLFLLTLPVPAWYITGIKALVLTLELLVYLLISAPGFLVAAWASGMYTVTVGSQVFVLPQALVTGAVWSAIAKMIVYWGVVYLFLIVLTQSVFIVGRLAPRRRGWVGLAGGFLFLWAFDRLYRLVKPVFDGVLSSAEEEVGFNFTATFTNGVDYVSVGAHGDLPLANGITFVLVLLLLFGVVAYVLERRMQVG